jgi:UDP-N-acetylmuramoyl-tripeptide--D-alanyl-D-alanine ligase
LTGPTYDGHDFIGKSLAAGAAGALVERGRESRAAERGEGQFLIRVEDSLKALGDLARFWRLQMPVKVAAITGSNGKTTTKEMAARILERRFRVLKTEGNLNNLIGLPLMLLKLSPAHEVAVLEMGMNHAGEIARLRTIAKPQVALITNIGRAHLEFLGTLDAVARAKAEIWEGLEGNDWIAVNADDPRVVERAAAVRCRRKSFGLLQEADLKGDRLQSRPGQGVRFSLTMGGGKKDVRLAAFGRHNVYNALGAAALASAMGLDLEEIVAGLEGFAPFQGRGRVVRLGNGGFILDDTYNANPDSLAATLAGFVEMKGTHRGFFVLGDMLEIGPEAARVHETAGRGVGRMNLEGVFFLGAQALHLAQGAEAAGMDREKIAVAGNPEEIVAALARLISPGDWVLVKGSRGMRMERVIEGLMERFGEDPE